MPRIDKQATSLPHVATHTATKKDITGDDETKTPDNDNNENIVRLSQEVSNQFEKNLAEIKKLASRLEALSSLCNLAGWDLDTHMPKAGDTSRAWQVSEVEELSHEILSSRKMERLLRYFEDEQVHEKLNKVDRSLLRAIKREFDKARKLPPELVRELAETTSMAHNIWEEAKESKDFKKFAPILKKIVELKRKEAEYKGYKDSPYDALINDFERGMTTKELDNLFAELKKELIPIINILSDVKNQPDDSFLKKTYSKNKLLEVSKDILWHIGLSPETTYLDETEHPECVRIGLNDIRIGTNVQIKHLFSVLGSALHEGGHGLYADGIDPKLGNTILHDSSSMGIDESQSRLYETIVGQGLSFWVNYFPKLQEVFPSQLGDVRLEDFYKAINIVKPSLIRTQADEVTYQLHVILRYEIEKDLIEGKLEVEDLPRAWNQKMEEYLGIKPRNDKEGVLQDVHWSCGMFGYFPTYSLGNLYAAQIYNTAKKEIPDLEVTIASGNMKVLRDWLKNKIHKWGDTKDTAEIIKKATGESLNASHYINYLKEKYKRIYPELAEYLSNSINQESTQTDTDEEVA